MTYEVLTIVALALSGVVCVCQVFIFISVFHFSVKLRRIQQAVDHLAKMKIVERNKVESLMRLPPTPRPGETVTMLCRKPHPEIPEQFVITEGTSQLSEPRHFTVTSIDEQKNEGFENSEWSVILRTALATLRNRGHDFILPAVKQNALRELLLIGVFLILFNCTSS